MPLLVNSFCLFVIVAVRYFIFAGMFYLLCYRWKKKAWAERKINPAPPTREVIRAEIRWSLVTSLLFAVAGALLFEAWQRGYTLLYDDPKKYGITYLILTIPLLMFLHDTYFYWIHRFMHLRPFFRLIHRVHHDSKDPTPWAAFSFHPIEGFLEAIILPLLVFVIPVNIGVFIAFLMIMTISSVINHIGYELFPPGFQRLPILKYWITATHHHQHHSEIRYNFGLYFCIWDHWMGTQHPRYDQAYDRVTGSRGQAAPLRTPLSDS